VVSQRDDAFGEDLALGDHEISLKFFDFEFWCTHHTSKFLASDEAGVSRGGEIFIVRKGETGRGFGSVRDLPGQFCW